MGPVQKSVELLNQGYNWGQAILAGFGEDCGLAPELGLRLGRAMSYGMARGLMCGAVGAAYLIIGLAQAEASPEQEPPIRLKAHQMSEALARRFEARHGSILCKDLLGADVATKEGRAQANRLNTCETVCPEAVRSAAELLNEALAAAPGAETQPPQTISSLTNP